MNKKQSKFTRAVPIYARLDPVTDKQLENYAAQAGVSKSLAVSQAVRFFLGASQAVSEVLHLVPKSTQDV